jgi:hypothetical protein
VLGELRDKFLICCSLQSLLESKVMPIAMSDETAIEGSLGALEKLAAASPSRNEWSSPLGGSWNQINALFG